MLGLFSLHRHHHPPLPASGLVHTGSAWSTEASSACGIVLPEGRVALLEALPDAIADAKIRLRSMLMDSLDEQIRRTQQLQADIGKSNAGSLSKCEIYPGLRRHRPGQRWARA
ncbi:hypothetical protein H6CHR_01727 [Variovorax sp. PBL-H6]|nr:hypothetical protein H6CHR_01727 [Variovorax sp. PBL-H6]